LRLLQRVAALRAFPSPRPCASARGSLVAPSWFLALEQERLLSRGALCAAATVGGLSMGWLARRALSSFDLRR